MSPVQPGLAARLAAVSQCCLLLGALLMAPAPVVAEDNPLQPASTSSPRETLKGFIQIMNDTHAQVAQVIKSYFSSDHLYLTRQENVEVDRALDKLGLAGRSLDLSELPAALANQVSESRVLQLKEILDRIDLPAFDQVPDAAAMEEAELDRWSIPGTEITIARVKEGARAGEWLFSPQTVTRLPGFYQKVQHLAYKPGATEGWYERYRYGGGGMYKIIPYRWMANLPEWSKRLIFDQPVWRWIASATALLMAAGFFLLVHRIVGRWEEQKPYSSRSMWARLLRALMLVVLMPVLVHLFAVNLRLSGGALEWLTLLFWGVFTLALTWSVWLGTNILSEGVVSSQQMLSGSIDSQLVRLGSRLVAIVLSITILVVGAQQLGIPAYSVVAGLGVGGVAVALAARDSLANLLGSLLIMFEKPFRVGHWIRVNDAEGNVEAVGFRSTRIRTFYNSVVSIPNNRLVNSTVDNLGLREYHRVRTTLKLTLDTSTEKINAFTDGIKQILQANPDTRKDYYQVVLHDIGEQSMDILVNFFLKVPNWAAEMAEREKILLEIIALAENLGIRFAFPTRTLHVDSLPEQSADALQS